MRALASQTCFIEPSVLAEQDAEIGTKHDTNADVACSLSQ